MANKRFEEMMTMMMMINKVGNIVHFDTRQPYRHRVKTHTAIVFIN